MTFLSSKTEEAELVIKALRKIREERDDSNMVDALLSLAEGGGKSAPDISLVVEADTLVGEFEGGACVPAETSRRLCCDAGITPVVTKEGKVLDVGRRTRTIPAAIRRALQVRDKQCRFPGCTHKRGLDGHHIKHWIDGGETKLDNLVLLCRRHHRYVHEFGFRVEQGPGGSASFLDPHGQAIMDVPAAPGELAIARRRQKMKQLKLEPAPLPELQLRTGFVFDPSM